MDLKTGMELGEVFAVVEAGGQGSRLWPLSRRNFPKQFLVIADGDRTLLQEAVRRAADVVGSVDRVLVVSQASQAFQVRQQLPDLPSQNILLEPNGRNTAACIGLAAMHIERRSPQAVMAIFPADHFYTDENAWAEAARTAIAYARDSERLVAIGILPDEPSSNYGYLHLGEALSRQGQLPIYTVLEFIEKPSPELARFYSESKDYLWNTGTFAWKSSVFIHELKRYLPNLYQGLLAVAEDLASWERLSEVYAELEDISVDHGVMEKTTCAAVVRGDFRRIDVGNLATLSALWSTDTDGNETVGELVSRDSRDNVVYSDEGLVGLIGVENLIIVRSGDVILVCRKERAAEVKELVTEIQRKGLERYL